MRQRTNRTLRLLFVVCLFLALASSGAHAQSFAKTEEAPGAPGHDAHWSSADKNGVGTSVSLESKVWFTLSGGVMSEVYYPTLDVPNIRLLQFVVAGADRRRVETEEENTSHRIEIIAPHALSFRQVNRGKSGDYSISKTYTTDPQRHTILIDVRFQSRNRDPYFLYVFYDPSLNNSGMHDSAWTQDGALLAADSDKASALVCSREFDEITNGYFETSDGLMQLRQAGRIVESYQRAASGNVVQLAR